MKKFSLQVFYICLVVLKDSTSDVLNNRFFIFPAFRLNKMASWSDMPGIMLISDITCGCEQNTKYITFFPHVGSKTSCSIIQCLIFVSARSPKYLSLLHFILQFYSLHSALNRVKNEKLITCTVNPATMKITHRKDLLVTLTIYQSEKSRCVITYIMGIYHILKAQLGLLINRKCYCMCDWECENRVCGHRLILSTHNFLSHYNTAMHEISGYTICPPFVWY